MYKFIYFNSFVLFQKVSKSMIEKYSCGMPFIPKQYFKFTPICDNQTLGIWNLNLICLTDVQRIVWSLNSDWFEENFSLISMVCIVI